MTCLVYFLTLLNELPACGSLNQRLVGEMSNKILEINLETHFTFEVKIHMGLGSCCSVCDFHFILGGGMILVKFVFKKYPGGFGFVFCLIS